MFKVYGADLTKAIAEFEEIEDAMIYAKKGLRNNGRSRMIKNVESKKWICSIYKRNGIIKVLDLTNAIVKVSDLR